MGPKAAKIQAAIWLAPAFAGGLAGFYLAIYDRPAFIYFTFAVFGVAAIIWAKLSLKRRTRILWEFGIKNMTRKEKCLYILGYLLFFYSTYNVFNLWWK